MSYGIEVQGHTTLIGWDDDGVIEPWSEIQAWAVMIRLRGEFRKLGVMPLMRVVPLPAASAPTEAPRSVPRFARRCVRSARPALG